MPDISSTIVAKSDQQNFDDFAEGPKTFTVAKVDVFEREEQPVVVHLVEAPGKAYKPSKSMRRVLARGWGGNSDPWPGRRLTLYGDPTVKWAGKEQGGIKIAAMSDIDKAFQIPLAESKGKRSIHKVEKLPDAPAAPSVADSARQAVGAFARYNVAQADLEDHLGKSLKDWTQADLDELLAYFKTMSATTEAGEQA